MKTAGTGTGALLLRAVLGSGGLRIVGMGLGFIVGIQLARGLGPTNYGIYAVALSFIALLTVPTEFGLPQLLTREVARAHHQRDLPLLLGVIRWADRAVVSTSVLVAILTLVTVTVLKDHVSADLRSALAWGMVLIPLVALGHLRGAALRGLQHVVLGQIPEVTLRPFLFSSALYIAFACVPTLTAANAVALNALTALGALILGWLFLRTRLPVPPTEIAFRYRSRAWLISVVPLALTEGMRIMQANLAILILGIYASHPEVASFRVASSTAVMVAMPITLLNVVAAPMIVKLHAQQERGGLQRVATHASCAMFCGVLLLSLPLLLAGKWLLDLVFGIAYTDAWLPLVILSFGHLISAAFGIGAPLLNMTGNERRVTHAFFIALTVNVVLLLILVPHLAGLGAALSVLLSLLVWNILIRKDVKRLLGVEPSILSRVTRS